VKALLELGAADVNCPAGPTGKTPLHIAAEMVCPDMVAVLLDHHADPNIRTIDGVTALDILRSLTSDFLFKGAVPGLTHIEPNKLRLCLELVQSAAMVLSREEAAGNPNAAMYGQPISMKAGGDQQQQQQGAGTNGNSTTNLSLDTRMVFLNLGMVGAHSVQLGCSSNEHGGREEGDSGSSNRSQGGSGNIMGSSSLYSPRDHFPN